MTRPDGPLGNRRVGGPAAHPPRRFCATGGGEGKRFENAMAKSVMWMHDEGITRTGTA